jgi:hypothetical protein
MCRISCIIFINLVFTNGCFPVTSTIIWIYHGGSIFCTFNIIATMELSEDNDDEIIVPLGLIDIVEKEQLERICKV